MLSDYHVLFRKDTRQFLKHFLVFEHQDPIWTPTLKEAFQFRAGIDIHIIAYDIFKQVDDHFNLMRLSSASVRLINGIPHLGNLNLCPPYSQGDPPGELNK